MKKHSFVLFAFVFFIVSCQKEDDFYFPEENIPSENEVPQDNSEEEGSLTLYKVEGDQIEKIKDFAVSQDLKAFQEDYAKHLQMWEFTSRLIPLSERGEIAQFEVFHGQGDLLGYVAPINENDLSRWKFALAIDAANDLENIDLKDFFTYVTIHEYGHVLTLNDDQIQVGNENSCNTFHTGEGCSFQNAYINRLFELGWKDIYDEFLDKDDPEFIYNKYTNRFVSDYAASNPGEDIAEVFAFFITQKEVPNGNTLAEQKIKLLYEFPELVQLRNRIRQNADVIGLRAGSWTTNPMSKRFKMNCSKACAAKHSSPSF